MWKIEADWRFDLRQENVRECTPREGIYQHAKTATTNKQVLLYSCLRDDLQPLVNLT
jgi:hypothetical protein